MALPFAASDYQPPHKGPEWQNAENQIKALIVQCIAAKGTSNWEEAHKLWCDAARLALDAGTMMKYYSDAGIEHYEQGGDVLKRDVLTVQVGTKYRAGIPVPILQQIEPILWERIWSKIIDPACKYPLYRPRQHRVFDLPK